LETKKQYVLSGSGVDGRQDGDSQCGRDAEKMEKLMQDQEGLQLEEYVRKLESKASQALQIGWSICWLRLMCRAEAGRRRPLHQVLAWQ
jgi:hypothetical protein